MTRSCDRPGAHLAVALRRVTGTAAVITVFARALAAQTDAPAYRNPALPTADRVRDLLSRMTVDEKFWQLFMIPGSLDDPSHDYSSGVFGLQIGTVDAGGDPAPEPVHPSSAARAHAERINAIQRFFVERTRLGIPIIPFDEALHGVMRDGATVFPQAIGLAATWDSSLVRRVAAAVARETRTRGIRQVLSPVVNLAADVRWGRVEETYGEDPYLTSVMARAFVGAMEGSGVIATPKHFVANVGAGGRDSYPIDYSVRALEETYFPAFRTAIRDGGARSIMSAYNSVDGSPATQSRWLLTDVLKRQWGFGGFVVSDAAATGGATVLHLTERDTRSAARHAIEAGLDVIFQSRWEQHRPYLDAFRSGLISAEVIDSAVARVLTAKFQLGLFERPYVDPDSAAEWNGHPDHRTLAREAARASIVLLKNDGDVLPLTADAKTIAVIGVDATEARLGGYSGPGTGVVAILDGLRSARPDATVRHAPGPGRRAIAPTVVPASALSSSADGVRVAGLRGEYFDNIRLEGSPRVTRTDPQVDFRWTFNAPARGLTPYWYSVRWTGTVTVPGGGRRLGVEGSDGYRLYLDDTLVIDNWRKRSESARWADVALAPGSRHDLRLEFFETTGGGRVRLVWEPTADGSAAERAALESATALARQSDVAVVVVGLEEGEFRDRAFLALPGLQERLISDVAATGTPVVVIVVGGSAVTMPWLDQVAAVADAWYPGAEGGRAVADVLTGAYNPAGRLPITFPLAEGQLPLTYNPKPTGRADYYADLTGQPLFPFGYGLSYTEFDYSDLEIEAADVGGGDTARVRVTVRNVGARAGDEVVQLYVRDALATVARPVMQLEGFARIHLAPGEEQEVEFPLTFEHLDMLNEPMDRVVEPGDFHIMVGASSKDIRVRGVLTVP